MHISKEMDQPNQRQLRTSMGIMEKYWNPKLIFLKTKLDSHICKISKTEWNAYFYSIFHYFLIMHYQEPKISSLQCKILRSTEASKDKMAAKASCSLSLASVSWILSPVSSCSFPLTLPLASSSFFPWESLGLQGDPTSPFWSRSALGFLWRE